MSTKEKQEKEIMGTESVAAAIEEAKLTPAEEAEVRRMMEAGVLYGYSHSRTNPKMKKYILSTRSGVEVIDLLKTMEMLNKAVKTMENIVKAGGRILFVGTSQASRKFVKESAERLGMPYIIDRWPGGMLTNFATLSQRIEYFRKLKEGKKTGEFEKYTKKEQLEITKELLKMNKLFGGIEQVTELPQAVCIIDLKVNLTAAREAKKKRIPSIALTNTDNDPELVDYPIPANDRSPKSIEFLVSHIETVLQKAKESAIVKRSDAENGIAK